MLMQSMLCRATLALMAASVLTPVAEAQNQTASQQAVQDIVAFGVMTVEQLRPGAVLPFRLDGLPCARASFQIGGATAPLLLNEPLPGHYEGECTTRLGDMLTVSSLASARLEKDGQRNNTKLRLQRRPGMNAGPRVKIANDGLVRA